MNRMLLKAAFAAALSLALMPAALAQSSGGTSCLAVSKGGTGVCTVTNHGVLLGSGTSDLRALGVPASGTLLQGAASADPAWTATPTLGVAGTTVGTLSFANATSGTVKLEPVTGALGTSKLSLPATTSTVAVTGNKLSAFASTTSAELAGVVSNESGTGPLLFGTGPDINGGTADALTSLGIRSTGAAFDLKVASDEVMTANRTLKIDVGDTDRKITLSSDLAGFGVESVLLDNGTDLDTVTDQGFYDVNTPVHGPLSGGIVWLVHVLSNGSSTTTQVAYERLSADARVFVRQTASTGTGTWSAWEEYLTADPATGDVSITGDLSVTGDTVSFPALNLSTGRRLAVLNTTDGQLLSGNDRITSADFQSSLLDQTGSGLTVFANSPALTGTPTAPTAAAGTSTTQLATTAFVAAANVATATALETARTIDGQSFDGSENIVVVAPATHGATSKTTPANADEIPLVDSAASNVLKKLTWANLKATLKTYFDAIYASLDSPTLTGTPTAPTAAGGTNSTQIATTAFVQSAVGGAGGFAAANQAQMEAATSNVVGVTPGRMHYHPALPKAIGSFTTATPPVVTTNFSALGTITATRNGVGDYTLSWTNSLTNPVGMFTGERTAGNGFASPTAGVGATSVGLRVVNGSLNNEDIDAVQFVIYGDL